ncbi:uncharacterized protein DS421_15g509480 [Arachis hypogaea]|nr:uncharacterized protein DS421_15g509480 [Arachis hypogaea]
MVAVEQEWRERIRRETRERGREGLEIARATAVGTAAAAVLCCSCSVPRCCSVLFVTVVAIAAAAVIVAAAGSGRSHRTIVLITPFHFMGCSAHISNGSPF